MLNSISSLQRQVQQNCHVSDANYSGTYSLCILLLRLRNLYKWEKGIPPWQEPDHSELLNWVEEREEFWQKLEGCSVSDLEVDGYSVDSMDAEQVNSLLEGTGLFYGAGLVTGMKPSFLLGRPVEVREQEGLNVCIVDQELARDIFSVPLMRQGNQIVGRRQAMASLLWDEVLELRSSTCQALAFAFEQHGLKLHKLRELPVQESAGFMEVVDKELETWVYHEIGEAVVDVFPGWFWQEMVSQHANTLVEVFARAVKDVLADTHPHGLLGHVKARRKSASLGFYLCFMRPLTKTLYPEITQAVTSFMQSRSWEEIERARVSGYNRARDLALSLVDIHESSQGQDAEQVRDRIVRELIQPLGLAETLQEEDAE